MVPLIICTFIIIWQVFRWCLRKLLLGCRPCRNSMVEGREIEVIQSVPTSECSPLISLSELTEPECHFVANKRHHTTVNDWALVFAERDNVIIGAFKTDATEVKNPLLFRLCTDKFPEWLLFHRLMFFVRLAILTVLVYAGVRFVSCRQCLLCFRRTRQHFGTAYVCTLISMKGSSLTANWDFPKHHVTALRPTCEKGKFSA